MNNNIKVEGRKEEEKEKKKRDLSLFQFKDFLDSGKHRPGPIVLSKHTTPTNQPTHNSFLPTYLTYLTYLPT